MKISPEPLMVNLPESIAEQVRVAFRTQGFVDIKQESDKRFGMSTEQNQKSIISMVYSVKKSMEKELGRKIVREGNIFSQQSILNQTIGNQQVQDTKPTIVTPKTKTAVLVVREVRDENGARYELDVVGEFNRGMMKEALKQLMEVFI